MAGLPLGDVVALFVRVFDQLREDGYFSVAFGFVCVDAGRIEGKVRDVELEMLLSVRKKGLWTSQKKDSSKFDDPCCFFGSSNKASNKRGREAQRVRATKRSPLSAERSTPGRLQTSGLQSSTSPETNQSRCQ
jgi:hypothetical protein